ncbi:hypothetical protein P3S68_023426 [Capsicum galapagoense]
MDTILAHLDAIAREIAKANAGLEKLGSDMSTLLERLDRVESRRNSRDSTSETLPQAINPPRPPPNDIDISQATKCPPTRDLYRSIPPPFDQVQQKGLGSQISSVQAPQPKLHFTKSTLSTETPFHQSRHVHVEENGRKEHDGYGVYDDACMMVGDLFLMRLKTRLKMERKPRFKMKMLAKTCVNVLRAVLSGLF